MKTTVKQFAAGTFIALLVMVGNVKAEGTELIASSRETIETNLQLENWMTDEALWNNTSVNFVEFAEENETALEMENWMTSERTWTLNNNFVEAADSALQLEGWMLNEKTWENRNDCKEVALNIEPWMISNRIWR